MKEWFINGRNQKKSWINKKKIQRIQSKNGNVQFQLDNDFHDLLYFVSFLLHVIHGLLMEIEWNSSQINAIQMENKIIWRKKKRFFFLI